MGRGKRRWEVGEEIGFRGVNKRIVLNKEVHKVISSSGWSDKSTERRKKEREGTTL